MYCRACSGDIRAPCICGACKARKKKHHGRATARGCRNRHWVLLEADCVGDEVADDQVLQCTEVHQVHQMDGQIWRLWSDSTRPQDVPVWKRRWVRALRVCKAEACPRQEQNTTNEEHFMFWRRSAADPALPLYQRCRRHWQRFPPGPRCRHTSRTASSDPDCASRPTNVQLWMTPATEPVRTWERSCQAPETTSCK